MEQLRMTDTPQGAVYYLFARKRVKNWNLRVRDGQVLLSAPTWVKDAQADAFIRERAEWICRALEQQSMRPALTEPPRSQCALLLGQAVEKMLPLVRPLGVEPPRLRLRRMKSRWGCCHYRQGYITLNTLLAACPEELRDYVALHELVHFLHPDHGPGFYARMDRLMPDWKERRRRLKEYMI